MKPAPLQSAPNSALPLEKSTQNSPSCNERVEHAFERALSSEPHSLPSQPLSQRSITSFSSSQQEEKEEEGELPSFSELLMRSLVPHEKQDAYQRNLATFHQMFSQLQEAEI